MRIGADSTVTVIVKHLEMGQGTYTGLPTLVAEELDADWAQVRAEGAPADAKRYNNLSWGEVQGTGGSSSMPNSYEQLRKAGAAARAMLVAAAAERWKVPARTSPLRNGVDEHKESRHRAQVRRAGRRCRQAAVPWTCRSRTRRTSSSSVRTMTRTDARGEVQRHRDLHAGREAARHADGARAARRASARS